MRKLLLFTLVSILAMSFSSFAQDNERGYSSSRLTNLSNQLKRQTVDLADRAYEDIRRGYNSSRSDIEAAFLAQQMDASAGLFQQLVRDNRRASELRDAASILSDLSRRSPNYGSNSYYWNDVKRSIEDINREIGGNNSGGGWGNNDNNYDRKIDSVRWRGTVDNEVHLRVRNNNVETFLFAGQNYGNGTFNFTSAMPNRNVNVYVNKKKGRGNVTVIQQPDRNNNYTAVIKILDSDGGAKEYDVEIYWTR
ncbi:MAG: hypothetical protein MUC29_14975 [Pyrinomonadaceae bacterium]|jgi:hypothetical protein|nr:hypothetical protein [Pyrinomonadaceae bacterium]